MAYRKVLIAVDGSDEAEQVVSEGIATVADSGAEIVLASVIRPLNQSYGGIDIAAAGETAIRFEREAEAQVRERLEKLGAAHGLGQDSIVVRHGNPAMEIHALAEEHGVDLIVVGTHGRHGFGLLLGQTANAVLHGVTCDVLAVRVKTE